MVDDGNAYGLGLAYIGSFEDEPALVQGAYLGNLSQTGWIPPSSPNPPPQEEETGWEPGEVANGVQVAPGDSCIGLQENPANEDFSPICESLFLSEDFKAENGSCLILDDKPDQPCFCKICGVKGGGDTMKFLCLKVVCQ